MPLYRVEHCIPLTIPQQDSLADRLTTLHSTRFTTPRMFVQIEFADVSATKTYIGGRRRSANHIRGFVRQGAARTQADWDAHCQAIDAAWNEVIGPALPKVRRSDPDLDTTLRSVIILGGMIAGVEAGFTMPAAGKDVQWMKENWEGFKKVAASGDEDFAEMVKDVEARGLLSGNGANGL